MTAKDVQESKQLHLSKKHHAYYEKIQNEIKKLSVAQSPAELMNEDIHTTLTKVAPILNQVGLAHHTEALPKESKEYHHLLSNVFVIILKENIISSEVFVERFLPIVVQSLQDDSDFGAIQAWQECLLNIIDWLPFSALQAEITPLAVSNSQMHMPLHLRLHSCKLLGALAKNYNINLIRSDLIPSILSLCQDLNSDVRACICLQLETVAIRIGKGTSAFFLTCLIELASDEVSKVKTAAFQTITGIISVLSRDTIESSILPLVKQLITSALKTDDECLLAICIHFGKLCKELEKYLSFEEKEPFIRWYCSLFEDIRKDGVKREMKNLVKESQLWFVDNLLLQDSSVLYRGYAAYNCPGMVQFSFDSENPKLLQTVSSALSTLIEDPCSVVRIIISRSFLEIVKEFREHGYLVKHEFIKLLGDSSDEVLEGIVPNLSEIIMLLAASGSFNTNYKESYFCLCRAVMKCDKTLSKNNNWRIQSELFKQVETVAEYFPSDVINSIFVPYLLRRINSSRALPIRMAALRTLYVFLNLLPKHQMMEVKSRILSELCSSTDYYNRMLYVRCMNDALSIFSTNFFKEHFFITSINMFGDPVANIRLGMCRHLPVLKEMLNYSEDEYLRDPLEHAIQKCSADPDKEIVRTLESLKPQLYKDNVNQVFYNCTEKQQEKKSRVRLSKMDTLPARSFKTGVSEMKMNFTKLDLKGHSTGVKKRAKESKFRDGTLRLSMEICDREFVVDTGLLPGSVSSKLYQDTASAKNQEALERPKRQGIPIRTSNRPMNQSATLSLRNKRHSIMVPSESKEPLKEIENPRGEERTFRRAKQSQLPRPLSCIGFVSRGEMSQFQTKPASRLPINIRGAKTT